ncbi:MAG: type II secretion system F family protein [Defluviitaleaceae bacterium]|nr:type II secretion system F family protein [Defluviitaleaceae bacterium]
MPIVPSAHKKMTTASQNISIWQTDIRDFFSRSGGGQRLPASGVVAFCRKLAFLLGAGLTVKDAMPIIMQQSEGGSSGRVISIIHNEVVGGRSFSAAIEAAGAFPEFMQQYIQVGEKTGQLAKACQQLADYYEQQTKTKSELISTMAYPATVILMMLAVIVLAVTMVLPGYARMFEASGVQLPLITSLLISLSGFFAQNFAMVLLLLATATLLLVLLLRKNPLTLHSLLLKSTLAKLSVNFHLSQTLTLVLGAGLTVSDALAMCINTIPNKKVQADFCSILTRTTTGHTLWNALSNLPYVDPLLSDMIKIGEETGEIKQTMEKCHAYFAENYSHNLRRISKLIEPTITIFMGFLLVLLILAVVLPTFEMAAIM